MKENVDKLRKERKQKLKKDQDKIDQFQEQQRRNEEARLKREETERAIHAKLNKGTLRLISVRTLAFVWGKTTLYTGGVGRARADPQT